MDSIIKTCVISSDRLDMPLKNGTCRDYKGYRCVLTDKDGVVQPVLFNVHTGSPPLQGTYQIPPKDGDYIFQVRWNGHFPLGHKAIYQIVDQSLVLVENEYTFIELWVDKLFWNYPKIYEFLNPVSRGSSFLPLNELNLLKRNKMQRLAEFLSEYDLFQFYTVDDFAKSPSHGLLFEPVKVNGWSVVEAVTEPQRIKKRGLLDNNKVNIDTKPRFFSFDGKQTNEIKIIWHFTQTVYNEVYTEEIAKGEPLVIPSDCQTLIVITKGAYIRQHKSHSYKINAFRLLDPTE